jgi:hypothetical protein
MRGGRERGTGSVAEDVRGTYRFAHYGVVLGVDLFVVRVHLFLVGLGEVEMWSALSSSCQALHVQAWYSSKVSLPSGMALSSWFSICQKKGIEPRRSFQASLLG